ncbi:hypothetical protein Herbaro_09265 [Herbaspirillum sp. WKF16]|uniref:hypothetical protein n=1 Tax=Herbaspirillum sp. WKF16 TaxID=3028312 RepID=UPI0023A9A37A|nr:hypothetical protein [Herbaspirillum sp. WKF16]WDZ97949.1 hypothetical protein Herbaro_09265 [Herbaspirillum sp. WKF16]
MSAAIKPTAGPLVVDTNTPDLPFRVYSETTQGNVGFFLTEADAQRFAAHEDLVRVAQLVLRAAGSRSIKDWQVMHMEITEAAELAEKFFPGGAA